MPRVVKRTSQPKAAKPSTQAKPRATGPDPSIKTIPSPTGKLVKPPKAVKKLGLPKVPALIGTQVSSKKAQVIALLSNPQGTNLAELMQATSWQAHSVRGFLSGTIKKKLGLNLIGQKINGAQVYRISIDD